MGVTESCGDSLKCLSQAGVPRGPWLGGAGPGGRRGCPATGPGSTARFQARRCDVLEPQGQPQISGAPPARRLTTPPLPLPPRMPPRRETRSKRTSRVRARRRPARSHGPTARTCTRTLKTHTPPQAPPVSSAPRPPAVCKRPAPSPSAGPPTPHRPHHFQPHRSRCIYFP